MEDGRHSLIQYIGTKNYKRLLRYSSVQRPFRVNDRHTGLNFTSSTATIPTIVSCRVLYDALETSGLPNTLVPKWSMRTPQPVVNVECRILSDFETLDTGLRYIMDDGSEGILRSLRKIIEEILNINYDEKAEGPCPPLWIDFPELGLSALLDVFTSTNEEAKNKYSLLLTEHWTMR
jgi:hypothetical protein